jgi:hypothetical protein
LVPLNSLRAEVTKFTIFHFCRVSDHKAELESFIGQINQFVSTHSGINTSFSSSYGDILTLQKSWQRFIVPTHVSIGF